MSDVVSPIRYPLPVDRTGITHAFTIGGVDGVLHLGEYGDGRLGEVFVELDKQGSALGGAYDSWARMMSIALQYRIPLKDIVSKHLHSKFEPQGITSNPDIRFAQSVVDYIARYLAVRYLTAEEQAEIGMPQSVVEAR